MRRIYEETLSFEKLISSDFSTGSGNDSLNSYYKIRTKKLGSATQNTFLFDTYLDNANGSITFVFLSESTPYDPDTEGHKKDKEHQYYKLKDLSDFNDAGDSSKVGYGKVEKNSSATYEISLRINDFIELYEELKLEDKENFTKEDMGALLSLSNSIALFCDCLGFLLHGTAYVLTSEYDDAAIKPCTIPNDTWKKWRDGVGVCKHSSGVLRSYKRYLNQMAQKAKSLLQKYGYME
jgi:hypothetical protein